MQTQLLLEMAADALGDRLAVGPLAGGLTFAQLGASARATASWLLEQSGEKLVFVGLNGNAVPVALFGAGLAG